MKFRTFLTLSIGAGLGAAAVYLLDPDQGAQRRQQTRDLALEKAREYDLDKKASYVAGQAKGAVAERTGSMGSGDGGAPNDATLRLKVESEALGHSDIPSGQVNVDAADGVVTLRGEVANSRLIDELVAATEKVDGVREVRNLLHLPSEPSPSRPDDAS